MIVRDADGVPHEDRVGEHAQRAHLVHYLLVVAAAEGTLVRKEKTARELVARLAAIELEGRSGPSPPRSIKLVRKASKESGLRESFSRSKTSRFFQV